MHKPPSWNQIRADAATFANRWADETDENAGAQSFWNEFLAIFGIDRKRVAVFEKRAERLSTGGRGRIDLFWPGVMLAEHKSAGKDLDKAEDQAIDYLESINQDDFPGLLVVSDFARMRVTDLGGDRIAYEFPTRDLVKEIDRFAYLAGYSHRQLTKAREHEVDIQAARLMGSLFEKVAETGFTEHEVSVFLVRMLFVMFADDTGLWEKSLFQEFVETRTQSDGSDLGSQIAILFQTLDRPEDKRPARLDELLARFPYVNGGLFSDRLNIPSFDAEIRSILLECCGVDWGSIVPAIFGSLFQAVKSKQDRRLLGEHYTTERNILRTIGPLFLDDLRADYETAFHDIRRLNRLRNRLGDLRFLDPAAGCGNFLVIAYREMRNLELDIMVRLRELTGEEQLALDATMGLRVSPSQFHGIELEEWPARIAETAMFLIDHQCNQVLARTFGQAPDRLPISTAADIRVGNALTMNWHDVLPASDSVVVLGNPPFIGMALMSAQQQADNRAAFAGIDTYGIKTGRLDYVACWYAKALGYIAGTRARCAFVSTNSITQGEQARTMLPLLAKHGIEIDFGHRTFKWTSEAPGAAAVYVVIIGFSAGGQAKKKRLFDYPDIGGEAKELVAQHINWYLVDGPDLAPEKRTSPLVPGMPYCTKGSQPTDGGHLFIAREDLEAALRDPHAAKYVRRFIGAIEMLNNVERWCFWLVDANPVDIKSSPLLRDRLAKVSELRATSPTASVREQAATPGLFTQLRQPNETYLALPQTSSENRDYIPAAYFAPDVIAGNALLTIPEAPLWSFGLLQSKMFMVWVDTYSGRLESRYQIHPGLVYFPFPFPTLDHSSRARVEQVAQAVLATREGHTGASLSTLYDRLAMPADLRAAHARLDAVIDGLFGLKHPTDAERLRALLKRYEELSTADQLPIKAPKSRSKR
jgi:hypothetical protein